MSQTGLDERNYSREAWSRRARVFFFDCVVASARMFKRTVLVIDLFQMLQDSLMIRS